jgi:hypothetical protein
MPIFRLAISLAVTAIFTYGIVSLANAPVPSAAKSAKRIVTNCPVEKKIAGGRCACEGQTNWSGMPCVPPPAKVRRRIGTTMLGRDLHSDNCVFFVRDRVPSLPYGLGTWTGKLAIINAHVPRPGDVAVIQVGSGVYKDVGHVAIVEEVTDGTITILEGNLYAGYVSRRIATGANAGEAAGLLNIVGYFRPSGASRGHPKRSGKEKAPAE